MHLHRFFQVGLQNVKGSTGFCAQVCCLVPSHFPTRQIHITSCNSAGQEWRKQRGKAANPNAYGLLTDKPDYTFVDGRPTPPGSGTIKRMLEQRERAAKIIELTEQVNFAVERYKRKLKEDDDKKSEILAKKLKTKGAELDTKK